MRVIFFLLFSIISVAYISCSTKQQDSKNNEILSDKNLKNNPADDTHVNKVKRIFFNVPTQLEIIDVLNKTGEKYNPELLNSVDNSDNYESTSKIALNLGIYGADLGCIRLFDQVQDVMQYLATIKKLSDKLGIPQDAQFFDVEKFERNINNRDSLLYIISETYSTTDKYLKENERGSTAALIILGGWTETLYLSSSSEIMDENMISLISSQYVSLINLIELVNLYNNEKSLTQYIGILFDLKSTFEQTNSVINNDLADFTNVEINLTQEAVSQIKKIAEELRINMIN